MECGLAGLRGVLVEAPDIGADRDRAGAGLLQIRESILAGREARPRAVNSSDEAHQPSGVRRSSLGPAVPPFSVPGSPFSATKVSVFAQLVQTVVSKT